MSYKQWRDILGVILDGAFLCSRAVLPHMVKNKFGRIINMGGVSSHLGAPGRAHVGAGKAGIVGFTRALASEFAPHGITVNCIVPGRIGGERSATSGHGHRTRIRRSAAKARSTMSRRWCGCCASRTTATSPARPFM